MVTTASCSRLRTNTKKITLLFVRFEMNQHHKLIVVMHHLYDDANHTNLTSIGALVGVDNGQTFFVKVENNVLHYNPSWLERSIQNWRDEKCTQLHQLTGIHNIRRITFATCCAIKSIGIHHYLQRAYTLACGTDYSYSCTRIIDPHIAALKM